MYMSIECVCLIDYYIRVRWFLLVLLNSCAVCSFCCSWSLAQDEKTNKKHTHTYQIAHHRFRHRCVCIEAVSVLFGICGLAWARSVGFGLAVCVSLVAYKFISLDDDGIGSVRAKRPPCRHWHSLDRSLSCWCRAVAKACSRYLPQPGISLNLNWLPCAMRLARSRALSVFVNIVHCVVFLCVPHSSIAYDLV